MKDLTDEGPKCLIQVRGRALLDRQLDSLRAAGIDEIAIVTGYKRERLTGRTDREFHNPAWERTNMVSSLACADEWLRENACVVSYSDIFFDAQAVRSLMSSSADLAIAFDPNWLALWTRRFGDPLRDAETFLLDADGHLSEIGNKPSTLEQVQGQYMGLLHFTPAGWTEIARLRQLMNAQQRDAMHMTGTLQCVLDAGRIAISAVACHGEWGEVDSAEDLAAYHWS